MSDVIWRRFSVQWNGLPVANLAVFVVGGPMYAAMSTRPPRSTSASSTSVAVRRLGRIARHVLEVGLPIGVTAWASAIRALSARST